MRHKEYDLEPEEQEILGILGTSLEGLRAQHADCPSPELLMAAQSGMLPEKTNRSINEHMAKCALCRVLAHDLADEEITAAKPEEEARIHERVFSVMRKSTAPEDHSTGTFWIWSRRAAPAAALAAVVFAVLWVRFHRTTLPRLPAPAAVQQPTVPAALSVFQWEKLPVKLEAGAALVWRGAPRTGREKFASQLGEALAFYQDDNFVEAAHRLNVLAGKYPRRPEAHLYLGICQLYLQKNAEAIRSLRAAQETASGPLVDDVTWYTGLAYERAGEKPLALVELRKLCGGKSIYANRACTGIAELEAAQGGSSRR